ncbi:MAG: hypothetical protein CMJ34_08090 [Phycisphaerae bacterium]|nr:hypothetical protein [Phycisphaerae bacterium]
MNGLVLFDDGRGRFGPMVDLRPTFDLRSGLLTTGERIAAITGKAPVAAVVPEPLAGITAHRHPEIAVNRLPEGEGPWLLINGRLLHPPGDVSLEPGTVEVDSSDGSIRRAVLDREGLEALLKAATTEDPVASLPDTIRRVERDEPPLAEHPWDIFSTAGSRISIDLGLLDRPEDHWMRLHGGTVVGDHPIRIAHDALLDPHVVLDARDGPIVVESDARVGSHSVLTGPCAIMDGTRVNAHAAIKANTVIGPGCRAGGEIGGTVFQGFSNKSHDGHLGDSWVGEWVNLGAGTVNSNLLNTYGDVVVRITPDEPRIRSGRQFLGCILGDHVKTAIGTRIMTGSVIGTGAMIASTAAPPTSLGRFAWLTDEGERTHRLDKFLDTARSVMGRRDHELDPATETRLRSLHEAAGDSRA